MRAMHDTAGVGLLVRRRDAGAALLLGVALLGGLACNRGRQHPALATDDDGARIAAAYAAVHHPAAGMLPSLVDALEDDNLAVRYYAIEALRKETGTDMGYHYAAPGPTRSAAVALWRDYLVSLDEQRERARKKQNDQWEAVAPSAGASTAAQAGN